MEEEDKLLTTAEVAALFRVDPKTVGRWAKAGRLTFQRTMGGHRRYKESHIREHLRATLHEATQGLPRHRTPPQPRPEPPAVTA